MDDCRESGMAPTWFGVWTDVLSGDAEVLIGPGTCFAGGGGWQTVPSSPVANVRQEQKPSDEVISNVSPSFDLCLVSIIIDTHMQKNITS